MHLTYKKKIFLYFLLVFTIFTVIIIAVQHNREKTYKAESFTTGLNAYAEVVSNCIKEHQLLQSKHIDSLKSTAAKQAHRLAEIPAAAAAQGVARYRH